MALSLERCKGSGRAVARKHRERAIFTSANRWMTFCPFHGGAVACLPGVPRRYAEHFVPARQDPNVGTV